MTTETVLLTEVSRPRQWPTISRRELKTQGFPVYGANGIIGFADKYTHEEPTIIIGCRGSCGSLHITQPRSYVTGNAMALDDLDRARVDPSYLFHFLNYRGFDDVISGTSQPQITGKGLSSVRIPQTSIDEQRRIAALLDKAVAIRHKRQQALALADDFLKSVFLEMFGDPHRNPHNYPVREFETLLKIPLRNGISPSSKGSVSAGVLTLSAITGEKFDATQIKEGKFLKPISKTDQVDVGDFYICRGNGSPDLVGKGYFASKSMKGVAFPDTMIAAKINAEEVCRGFFEVIWNSQFVRGQIIEAARTTNGTYKINQTATGGIKIPTPPKAAQETFEDVFRKVHDLRERLSFEDDLFASLSQRAFRGEL